MSRFASTANARFAQLGRAVCEEAVDLGYRADVDGLRGIAVLAVVAFHANFYTVSGGFVGVDVFFVISGFLITRIILRDLAAGRFTLAHFYERRVRRILPALFLMLAVVTFASLALSPPARLHDLGRALLFNSFFGTNFLFAAQTNYFDPGIIGQPLLHTWSLSVEEQYYFVYPTIVLLLFARKMPLAALLLLGGAATLAFSEWQLQESGRAAFYGTASRAWELFAGGLLAGRLPTIRSRAALELIAFCGALAIAASFVAFSPTTPFPGVHALVPVVGTFAVIYAGGCGRPLVNRVLAKRPIVWVGLISYGLYLWHWPLLMLLRDLFGDEVGRRYVILCILLSLGLAAGSLFLFELPIRERTILSSRRQVFTAAAIGLVALAAAGGWLSSSSGLQWRYPVEARALLRFADEQIDGWHYGSCFITDEAQKFSANRCLRINPRRRNVLLLGDSHAAHLRSGIEDVFPGINILQASGCNPMLGAEHETHCSELREATFRKFLPPHPMDMIIVSMSWSDDENDVARIASTVAYLHRFSPHVVVIGPTPLFDRPEPDLLAFDRQFGTNFAPRHWKRNIAKLDARMQALARKERWSYVSAYQALCHDRCVLYAAPGVPLFRDGSHFTVAGSRLFAGRVLRPVLVF